MSLSVKSFFDAATATFSHVVDDGAGTCAVIDPVMGFDPRAGRTDAAPAQAIAEDLAARGLTLAWLLETHAHADHLSGAPWLQQRLGGRLGIGARIVDVQRDFRGIFNVDGVRVDGSQFDHLFADDESFAIGRLRATAVHVPGHTPADVAYCIADPDGGPDALFVGDTLFAPDVGTARCDFPGGDAHQLHRSIRRLLRWPDETLVYLCHDYPPSGRTACCVTTVGAERAGNLHVRAGIGEAEFVALRKARDATLAMPLLMLPAVQVNIRAGRMPEPEQNGVVYLKIPVDRL